MLEFLIKDFKVIIIIMFNKVLKKKVFNEWKYRIF